MSESNLRTGMVLPRGIGCKRCSLFAILADFGFQTYLDYIAEKFSLLAKLSSSINMETYPHLVSSQSLRRAKQSLRRAKQSLRRSKQSLRRSNAKSLRRAKLSLRRTNQSLRRSEEVIHEQNIYNIVHLCRTHSSYIKCINSDHCAYSCRSTVRKLTKQANAKRTRDRAPSRLPLKRIILAMRRRKNTSFLKHYFVRTAPRSSILNKIASNFKQCCFQYVQIQHIFMNSFGYFKPCVNLVPKNMYTAKQSLCNMLNSQNIAGNFANEQYHISQRALMLSGDIEINPGPVQNNSPTRLSSNVVLQQRLRRFQLRPFDVGGDGEMTEH